MLPTTYDSIIEKHRGAAPAAFIKALIRGESGFKPNGVTGSYRGLMQVGIQKKVSVLVDYNERHGTSFQPDDLFDPDTNVMIGCETINRIISAYDDYSSLWPNWNDSRYVALVMFGWNAGYSKGGGVQYVVGVLESKGLSPAEITIDTVSDAAGNGTAPKASGHLANKAKVAYCKKVARWTAEEMGLVPANPIDDVLWKFGIGDNERNIALAVVAGLILLA